MPVEAHGQRWVALAWLLLPLVVPHLVAAVLAVECWKDEGSIVTDAVDELLGIWSSQWAKMLPIVRMRKAGYYRQ